MNSHIRAILAEVAAKHHVAVTDIMSKSRFPKPTAARWEVFYRIAHERDYKFTRIAAIFSVASATVHYGITRHAMINDIPCRYIRAESTSLPVHNVGIPKRRMQVAA